VRPSYPESDRQNGICVEATEQRQIVQKCLQAASNNLHATIEEILNNPARQEEFIKFQAGINRFCRFVDNYSRPLRNATNSACANLGERLAQIQFNVSEDSQTCTVLEDNQSTGDTSCPRSLKLLCEFNGLNYIGFVPSADLASLPGALTAGQRLSAVQSNNLGNLVDRACGEVPASMNTNCTIETDEPLNQSVSSTPSVPGCSSNLCHLRASCGVDGRAYPVNAFCDCPDRSISMSDSARLVACAQHSLQTLTPVNFAAPGGSSSTGPATGAGSN
jgi:hypothetical protein